MIDSHGERRAENKPTASKGPTDVPRQPTVILREATVILSEAKDLTFSVARRGVAHQVTCMRLLKLILATAIAAPAHAQQATALRFSAVVDGSGRVIQNGVIVVRGD